jgi:hypothetical protein
MTYRAAYLLPEKTTGPHTMQDFAGSARAYKFAVCKCNVFLDWFKSIYYLSLSPSFTILTNTLSKSMGKVSEFMMMFMVILGGFAQSHTMVFGPRDQQFDHRGDQPRIRVSENGGLLTCDSKSYG